MKKNLCERKIHTPLIREGMERYFAKAIFFSCAQVSFSPCSALSTAVSYARVGDEKI
jgi:hypothetical protein